MVKLIRHLLFPFSLLYGLITLARNVLFDFSVLKSSSFDIPTILVGNLSAGGTGKTPHVEYLIQLLKDNHKIATLSRGYGRKSNGFVLADQNSTAQDIGDEPLQFFHKFPEITVAVDAKRVQGIIELMSQNNPPEVILLDDAFQHRALSAGFSILLTDVNSLFYNDFMLPTGNLREFSRGKNRADAIVVTKCSSDLTIAEKKQIELKINTPDIPVFFSQIDYSVPVPLNIPASTSWGSAKRIVLVTGIANPAPLLKYLTKFEKEIVHLKYPDHHSFTEKNIRDMRERVEEKEGSILLTTEKDAMRLKGIEKLSMMPLFYLPITIQFQEKEEEFITLIKDYVANN